MKTIHQLIFALSALMGVWVIRSFVGVMFNAANAGFWTTSLMWALLASVAIMPALIVAHHANSRRVTRKATEQELRTSAPPVEQQPPFIDEEEQEGTLWPEPENRFS